SRDDTVSVISPDDGRVVATVPVGRTPGAVAVSPDGGRVYVANQGDGTISVLDATQARVVSTVSLGTGSSGIRSPSGLAVSPDGAHVYVAGAGGTLSTIDTAAGQVSRVPLGEYAKTAAVSPDGRRVYVTNFDSTQLAIVDPASATVSTRALAPANGTSPGDVV